MINTNLNRVMSALAAIWAGDPLGLGLGSPRKAKRRPTGAQLRNPSCPFQAERIAKAQAKRERKANKRNVLAIHAYDQNTAWDWATPSQALKQNPLYVNR